MNRYFIVFKQCIRDNAAFGWNREEKRMMAIFAKILYTMPVASSLSDDAMSRQKESVWESERTREFHPNGKKVIISGA